MNVKISKNRMDIYSYCFISEIFGHDFNTRDFSPQLVVKAWKNKKRWTENPHSLYRQVYRKKRK